MRIALYRFLVAAGLLAASSGAALADHDCPAVYSRGVLGLDINPAFLHVDRYDDGSDGLTITSFVNGGGVPDQVGRIGDIGAVHAACFDPSSDYEQLSSPATVWPNEAVRAPDGVFPFEAVVIPQGFHPSFAPGRLTAIDLDDPLHAEYVIHQSTQNYQTGFTFPGDPGNSPRFYHRVLFVDMDGDGLLDLLTVRSGFRVVPSFYPPFAELVYFKNPGAALDPQVPWSETVLWGGPAAGFLGPDIHLDAADLDGDGVVEIVATHFFSGQAGPGGQPVAGKITLYGAPAGRTWADVNALMFRVPRMVDISTDQGFPFDVQITDLNHDGRLDVLASNHQPDGCGPATSSPVPGRVYALEPPASGAIFTDPWTTHILLDDIRPNATPAPAMPPGRLAPGRAQSFYPLGALAGAMKPHIVVGGDEAGKVWVLRPTHAHDAHSWSYQSSVIFDINDFYGPGTTQTPLADRPGVTVSTIGGIAVRYRGYRGYGAAELYVPVFEGRDIHVLTYAPRPWYDRVSCLADTVVSCPLP